ncbi:MAG: DUF4388 domain-containing protein [Myxococcaceae bacterium]|nr:DUF4388 domain-containing protein [Myxococcaceae bacterium]
MSDGRVVVAGPPGSATVEVPRPLATAWKPGTSLEAHVFGPEAALLVRGNLPATGFFAGSLTSLSIEEAFAQAVSGVRTGRLLFARGAVRKSVTFRDGQVVFASSSEPWERLGSVLVALRLVTREELAAALTEVRPGTRLGQVLTRTGRLSPARLYSAMTQLTRDIVLNLLTEEGDGRFLFFEGLAPSDDALKLPWSTRELVLSGLRRRDEVSRWRRQLPSNRRLRRGRDPGPGPGRLILEKAGDGAPISALRAGFEGSDYTFYSRIHELLESGALLPAEPAPAPPTPEAAPTPALAIPPVLERYAALVRAICEALGRAGEGLDDLRSFLSDPLPGMEEGFRGVTLSDDGVLDTAQLVKNLGDDRAVNRARSYELLDAFVSYALFSARNVLPAEVSEALTAQARKIQEGLP